ncbi:UNVERIFIED_CONTAM: hypothetical protein K2H54_022541 [Gekko kuhli]
MEYNLHRKKKLISVFKASIYKVHDRVEFASITRDLLRASQEQKRNPLHDDICYGFPFKLRPVTTPVTTIWKVRVPSLEGPEERPQFTIDSGELDKAEGLIRHEEDSYV